MTQTVEAERRIPEKEFLALCSLIADEKGRTLALLSREFKAVIVREPEWKDRIASDPELSANENIRGLVEETQCERVEKSFKQLLRQGAGKLDLEEGLFLLSSFYDPFLRKEDVSAPLDKMAEALNPLLEEAGGPEQAVRVFRQFLFDNQSFHGNIHHYYDPDNSYLHRVLERKTGIPISLSSVCLLLAKRLRWRAGPFPLAGIGLPGHFIIQFRSPESSVFIDPFNRGKLLTRKDCVELLQSYDVAFQDSYLSPVSSHTILCRTITNLHQIYNSAGEEKKKDRLQGYLKILNDA